MLFPLPFWKDTRAETALPAVGLGEKESVHVVDG